MIIISVRDQFLNRPRCKRGRARGEDDTICKNSCDTIGPDCFPYSSSEFIWTSLPFDSSLIGQEHIQNPIVCPDTTTIYILSLTEQGECEILADTVRILVIEKSDSITWTGDTIICDSASTFILNFFPTDTTVASISWYLPPIATITGGNGFNLINIEWSTLPDTIVPIIAHIYYYGGCDTTDTLWVYPCCWDTTRIMLRSGTLSSSLGSIASNQQYIVYGVLNIDDDFTFDNCDVIMAPGAIIAVYV